MDADSFDYDADECPNCHSSEGLLVKTLIHEASQHSDGEQSFKGGGMPCGEVEVSCMECEEELWSDTDIDLQDPAPDASEWEAGQPCVCGNKTMDEVHLDVHIRGMDRTYLGDGDRLATIKYECRSCDRILQANKSALEDL